MKNTVRMRVCKPRAERQLEHFVWSPPVLSVWLLQEHTRRRRVLWSGMCRGGDGLVLNVSCVENAFKTPPAQRSCSVFLLTLTAFLRDFPCWQARSSHHKGASLGMLAGFEQRRDLRLCTDDDHPPL